MGSSLRHHAWEEIREARLDRAKFEPGCSSAEASAKSWVTWNWSGPSELSSTDSGASLLGPMWTSHCMCAAPGNSIA